jgi:hypothetical protein
MAMVTLSRRLDLSVTAIGKTVIAGERLAKAENYSLIDNKV